MASLKLTILLSLLFGELMLSLCNPEAKALMALKESLDPDNLLLSSWTSGGNYCLGDYLGVACNEHGKVANISLQGKGLKGTISPAIAEFRCLSGLYLHYNQLSGEIPKEIANLTELTDLYLNVNSFSGTIPAEIGNMASLQVLQLCYNQLTGNIPTKVGNLKKLTVLALQFNYLTGAIPASLGNLQQLVRLDLSFNRLFGSIPVKLAEMPLLAVLDIRNNSLSGNVPLELSRLNDGFQYTNNKGLCGVGFTTLNACNSDDPLEPNKPEPFGPNSTGLYPHQIPQSARLNATCSNSSCSESSKSFKGIIIVGIIAVLVVALIVSIVVLTWYRRQKQKIGSSLEISDSRLSTDQPQESYRKNSSALISLEYSNGWDPLSGGKSGVEFSEEVSQSFKFNLEEVECATQYYSEVNLLGKSNFAATYKGILRDGSVVAIKSISKSSCKAEEADFLKGLKILTLLQHENLVILKGFCCSRGRGECFLVYEFISNGCLSDYLDVKGEPMRILDWPTRVGIIKGIAKGIEYLHSTRANMPPLVHQNISADKILIDQYFTPHLSACGLHKLLADDVVFSTLKGSAAMGYLAPEYAITGRFTEKSDVYAFGVVIFQILAGKMNVSHLRLAIESGKLEDLLDKSLNGKYATLEAAKLAGIALVCTSEAPSQRPTIDAILQQLNTTY